MFSLPLRFLLEDRDYTNEEISRDLHHLRLFYPAASPGRGSGMRDRRCSRQGGPGGLHMEPQGAMQWVREREWQGGNAVLVESEGNPR